MTEHSDAAKAAYPDEYYDAGLGLGPQLNPWTAAYRSGFDRGAATTYAVTREALIESLHRSRWRGLGAMTEREAQEHMADAIFASDALVDVDEVKCEHGISLHDMCRWVSDQGEDPLVRHTVKEWDEIRRAKASAAAVHRKGTS